MTRNLALIYIRKSVLKAGTDPISPERQQAACIAFAEAQGWETDVFIDAGAHTSGRTEDRPEWQRLKAMLPRPNVVAVIVESLSRATRSIRDLFDLVDTLCKRNIRLVSLKEQFDTTSAMGRAMLGMVGLVNQLESDLAAERVSDSISSYRSIRKLHWGTVPFGCERKDGKLTLSHHTEDVTALNRCYTLYADGNVGEARCALLLNQEGHKFRNRHGERRQWTASDVRRVLNLWQLYAGHLRTGRSKDGPAPQVFPNTHDPLLNPDLCAKVGAVLARRRQESQKTGQPHSLRGFALSQIISCESCGAKLQGSTQRKVYRHNLKADCPEPPAYCDVVEAEAIALLKMLAVPPGVLRAAYDRYTRQNVERPGQAAVIASRITACNTRISNLLELRIEGEIDKETYRLRKTYLENERAQLMVDMAEIGVPTIRDLDALLETLTTIGALLENATPTQLGKIIPIFLRRVTVKDGHLHSYVATPEYAPLFEAMHATLSSDVVTQHHYKRQPRVTIRKRTNPDAWSYDYPACVDCGRTDRRHRALGLCAACYVKHRRHAKKEKKEPPAT